MLGGPGRHAEATGKGPEGVAQYRWGSQIAERVQQEPASQADAQEDRWEAAEPTAAEWTVRDAHRSTWVIATSSPCVAEPART